MTLPSLPTDNFYKFLLFLSLASIVYLKLDLDKQIAKSNEFVVEIDSLDVESSKLLKTVTSDTVKQNLFNNEFKSYLQDFNSFFQGSFSEYKHPEYEYNNLMKRGQLYDSLLKEREKVHSDYMLFVDELVSKSKSLHEEITTYKLAVGSTIVMLISAFLVFLVCFLVWMYQQNQIDKISNNEYAKAINEGISTSCQSCGMELKYTKKIINGRYCSYCHGSYGYTHLQATLDEFKKLVSDRMKEQGFTDKQISKHLKSLPELDRWKQVFRWS